MATATVPKPRSRKPVVVAPIPAPTKESSSARELRLRFEERLAKVGGPGTEAGQRLIEEAKRDRLAAALGRRRAAREARAKVGPAAKAGPAEVHPLILNPRPRDEQGRPLERVGARLVPARNPEALTPEVCAYCGYGPTPKQVEALKLAATQNRLVAHRAAILKGEPRLANQYLVADEA
jgi:hypothetical protein